MSPRNRGFTLVELLVVIAIIGILVALLLPAIQAAREAARRTECTNKVKQVSLAMQNHHDIFKKFPANNGGNSQYNTSGTGVGWIVGVLPFMEQRNLHATIKNGTALSDAANDKASKTILTDFVCPSDTTNGELPNRANVGDTRAITNYKAVAGGNWDWGDHTGVNQPGGRWAGQNNGLDRGNGIICRNADSVAGNKTKFADITDGTSKTFAVGETVAEWCSHTWWYWFNGSTATCGVPLNHRKGATDLVAARDDWGRNYSFFSRHPGGGNFGLCDGSVSFITDTIDITVYRQLATISGGEAVSAP